MGIEHSFKESDDSFARCPSCKCVTEFDTNMPLDHMVKCSECEEPYAPHHNLASWQEFWAYCQGLKA